MNNMKARNKKTGEIVEYYITNHYKTDEEFYFTKQDSAMNYGEFNELYEFIHEATFADKSHCLHYCYGVDTVKIKDSTYMPDCIDWNRDVYDQDGVLIRKARTLTGDDSIAIGNVFKITDSDELSIDPNHPYGGMEVLDNVPVETWVDRFNMEFVDEDTGLLNISKYDHERIINFFNQKIK